MHLKESDTNRLPKEGQSLSDLRSQQVPYGHNTYYPTHNGGTHLKVRNEPSSEELFVAAFLRDSGLKYESEVPLYNLHGDTKKYRIADFKLINLGVYVEYFGQYNSTKEKRAEYDKKADVYIKNSIPTIFIYPHELGFLEYAFHFKMVKLLQMEKFNFKKSLFRYRMNRFKENFLNTGHFGGFYSLFLSVFIFFFFAFVETGLSDKFIIGLLCGSLWIILYSLYNLGLDIRSYFFRDE
jgi:hypothetical protein